MKTTTIGTCINVIKGAPINVLAPVEKQHNTVQNSYAQMVYDAAASRDGHGAGLARPGPGPYFFFWDPDPDPDPKGPKFSDPDPDPTGLTGSRVLNGSLMGLIQSLFDLSKLNLFRVFLYFCKQLIIVLQILVRVHEIQIQNNY